MKFLKKIFKFLLHFFHYCATFLLDWLLSLIRIRRFEPYWGNFTWSSVFRFRYIVLKIIQINLCIKLLLLLLTWRLWQVFNFLVLLKNYSKLLKNSEYMIILRIRKETIDRKYFTFTKLQGNEGRKYCLIL